MESRALPLTSLHALLLQRRSKTPLPYDTAWRQARMLHAPDEMAYRLHGHHARPGLSDTPDPAGPYPPDPTGRPEGGRR
ncbi:hypothetical protein ACFQ0G_00490 [Streptomyces chiangmaiensis]